MDRKGLRALLIAGAMVGTVAAAQASPCDLAGASPWIQKWLSAWELMSREILRIPDARPPEIVLFDSLCVYTTSAVAAPGATATDGPTLLGAKLPWRTAAHGDSITFPTGDRAAVAIMSFTSSDKKTGPFFVMAAPSYWEQKGIGGGPGLTGVFLHEFAHTRQVRGMLDEIGPIDSAWKGPEVLDDDVIQSKFSGDSAYVSAYQAERDLLYRAAAVRSRDSVRTLASQALAMMRRRHARWFRGGNQVFSTLDNLWLSLEGAGQWAGYAWLAHPKGGGLDRDAANARISGRRRRWSQDEGLGLFLVVDRLLPEWPKLVFGERSIGAIDLLDRAVHRKTDAVH